MRGMNLSLPGKETDQNIPASDEAMQDLVSRRDQFIGFMRWTRRAAMSAVPIQIIIGYVSNVGQLYVLALVSLLLYLAAAVAQRLARAGRLSLGVYAFVGTVYIVLAPLPLVVTNLLPLVIIGNVVAMILVGLFVSPPSKPRRVRAKG